MPKPVKILIIFTLNFPVFLWRNNDFHASRLGYCDNLIGIISAIGKQSIRVYAFNKFSSLLTISRGTLSDKDSDGHTIRIHGQMYLGVEPPFVRLMS